MIRKNYYKRITESIVKAYHDSNLDSAMGSQEDNMGKKIVAIITADPDQDLEWDHQYQPFGRTALTQDDEDEAYAYEYGDDECEGEDCEYEDECEGDECDEPVIGSGFEDEDEDGLEGIKDVLMDIRDELSHLHASDDDLEDEWEADDENPMFGSSDDFEDEDEDEDDGESALEAPEDWADDEESDDDEEEDEDDDEEDEDIEEDEESDFLGPAFRDDAPKFTPAKPTKHSSMREEDILGPAFRDDAPKFRSAKPTKKSSSRAEDFLGPAFLDDAPTKSFWEQEEETIDDDDEIAIFDSLDN